MEKAFFIEGIPSLFSMLFYPKTTCQKLTGFIIIHPFAEEKKSAHRTLVNLSRKLSQEDFPVMMFDLEGCGDSQGDFSSVRLYNWLNNIERVVECFRQHIPVSTVELIGLRFGAFLSTWYVLQHQDVAGCIWIEPVIKPIDYLRKSLRHKLMKELLTEGKTTSNRDSLLQDLSDNKSIDFDGYRISSDLFKDLLILQDQQSEWDYKNIPVKLLVSVSLNGRMSRSLQELCACMPEMQNNIVQMELFWNKISDVKCEGLINSITDYLKKERYE